MSEKIYLDPNGNVVIPGSQIPGFRTDVAIQNGVEREILMRTWGGLGDQICAEPTLRFAITTFKDCRVSLASECPELFRHLPFKEVFDLRRVQPHYERYLLFDTIQHSSSLLWQFMSHMLVHCVDFCSLAAFRCQLPTAARELRLVPTPEEFGNAAHARGAVKPEVVVHAGRHWQSKTFPAEWWNEVLARLVKGGVTPILMGANTDDNRGTVDVDTTGCLDLRNRLTIMESVALLQSASVLLTNDSAPLHMAASGCAWIGFVATCKHPDYLTHWRLGKWGWRMRNFGRGGIWDVIDYCPNEEQEVSAEFVGDTLLRSWLPDPGEFAQWAIDRRDARDAAP